MKSINVFVCLILFSYSISSIKSREPWFSTIPGSSSSDDEEQRE